MRLWLWQLFVLMLAFLQRRGVLLVSILLAFVYWLIFIEPFFPNHTGGLGHDYRSVMSDMLTGFFHYHLNPLGTVPWFTPASCGGNMFIAGVANHYINLLQWLFFYLEPLYAIKITFIVFAMAGFAGTYWLLKDCFHTDRASALVGASIMLFNGFFAYRMIIGHVGFHSFMLAPAIAYFLMASRWHMAARLTVPALLFSYMILSSGVYTLVPTLLMIGAVFLTLQLRHESLQWQVWSLLFAALLLAFVISAFKISLSFNVAQNFDRSQYALPGVPGLLQAIWLPIRLLFISTPDWMEETRFLFVNYDWNIGRHELEMGVGWVTLPLLGFALYRLAISEHLRRPLAPVWLLGILVALLIPVVLNYYTPAWNEFLKSVPIVKSFSLFVRFYAVYIPLVALWAALAMARLPRHRVPVAAGVIVILVATNGLADKSHYHQENYDPTLIKNHHVAFLADPSLMPPVNMVTFAAGIHYADKQVRLKNETFVYGASNINCFNDIFGYRLEDFPQVELLKPEVSVLDVTDGRFNLKNPACYIFPEENQCEPGDHFLVSQEQDLREFVHYRNYRFNMPGYQLALNWLGLVTFVGVFLVAMAGLYRSRRRRLDTGVE